MRLLVATGSEVLTVEAESGRVDLAEGLTGRPTCLAADLHQPGRGWCGTRRGQVLLTDDGGSTWRPGGSLSADSSSSEITALAASPAEPDLVWAGTEPSAIWRSSDGGERWERMQGLEALPSSDQWAFPPRPSTHHVRWIATHPRDAGRLWVAIEAGALIRTGDGGRSWRDRVPGGPYDTHELAVHPEVPETLRVAAGDGYFESEDGGETWRSPEEGLEVTYLRSVAIDPGDPDTVLVSGASGPRSAYTAGRSDGRIYRRSGRGSWTRIRDGWPDPPSTIAPLLHAGVTAGELWAVDERGVHRSGDGGVSWSSVVGFPERPEYLRGLVVLPDT